MKTELTKIENNYHLTITYQVSASLEEVWNLLATDQGFSRWFPQLHIEGDKLVFEMEDFREEMPVLTYREQEVISYDWAGARVTFSLEKAGQKSQITFEEIIPQDFGNDFTNAKNDMTGWLVQNDFIQALLSGQEPLDRADLHAKWSAYLKQKISK